MKKLFLLFALVLTVCNMAMAQTYSVGDCFTNGDLRYKITFIEDDDDGDGVAGTVEVTTVSINATQHYPLTTGTTSVTIPQYATVNGKRYAVTNIAGGEKPAYGAFCMSNIQTINFVETSLVATIGDYAFHNSATTSITLPATVTTIGKMAFASCTSLASVTLSEGLTTIGQSAFNGCISLQSITLPESVESIGQAAFSGCKALTDVTVTWTDDTSIPTLGKNAFSGIASGAVLHVPAGTQELYEAKDWGKWFNIEVPLGTNQIAYTSSDGNVIVPADVGAFGDVTIKSNTYENGKGVITFSGELTSIGYEAFSGCSSLTSLTIPSSVMTIGDYAFSNCSSLTSLTIPSSVTTIEDGAFDGCSSLTSVTIPSSVTSIGNFAFRKCSSLTSITIPSSVEGIGMGTFKDCTGLTSITIPSSVTTIGVSAFEGCIGLTSITIPGSVTSIGNFAFRKCSSLTSITIPGSVKSIGNNAFSGCNGLYYANFLGETPPAWGNAVHPEWYPFWDCRSDAGGTVLFVPNDNAVDGYIAVGYTNVYSSLLTISEFKNLILNEIEKSLEGVTLKQADSEILTTYKVNINNATDIESILIERGKALLVINLQKAKDAAIAEIDFTLNNYIAFLTQEDVESVNKYKSNIEEAANFIHLNEEIAKIPQIILPVFKNAAKKQLKSLYSSYVSDSDYKLYFDRIDAADAISSLNQIAREAKNAFNEIIKNFPHFLLDGTPYFTTKVDPYAFEDFPLTQYFGNISFPDGATYQSNAVTFITGNFEYTRTLPEGVWQCWYEPFEVKVDTEQFDAAEVAYISLNAQEDVVVCFKKLEHGAVMKLNTIYVIRAKEGHGKLTFYPYKREIYPSTENQLTLQSAYENFTLTGNYSPVEHGDWYTLDGTGKFSKMSSGSLKPQRFYLTITPRKDGHYYVDHYNAKQFIDIMVLGDEEDVTGIESLTPTLSEGKGVIYDLMGRKATSIQKGQVYIMNGKKFIAR